MGDRRTLAAYTLAHLGVDFTCLFLLFAWVRPALAAGGRFATALLLYNFLAFGLQPVVGALADRLGNLSGGGRRGPGAPAAATLGCALLLAGVLLRGLPWPALALAGLGNACFHVGGGVDSLAGAKGKMARSGVFVASGALGVALGTMGGRAALSLGLPLAAALACLALCLLAWRLLAGGAPGKKQRAGAEAPVPIPAPAGQSPFAAVAAPLAAGPVIALCFVSILVRAWAGGMVPTPWKNGLALSLLPAAAALAGKTAGGFLADRFGARTVGVGTLLLSIPLLVFGSGFFPTGALGILLFNMNMSITLCAIAATLPQSPGLAFGLTTLGLLGGSLPLLLRPGPAPPLVLPCIAGATLLSAVCLFFATRNQAKKGALS